jgi:hypothetical protein
MNEPAANACMATDVTPTPPNNNNNNSRSICAYVIGFSKQQKTKKKPHQTDHSELKRDRRPAHRAATSLRISPRPWKACRHSIRLAPNITFVIALNLRFPVVVTQHHKSLTNANPNANAANPLCAAIAIKTRCPSIALFSTKCFDSFLNSSAHNHNRMFC